MAPTYKEADFPPDYRETEVQQIMDALYKLRSATIIGLAGMGKSNIVRFVVSHPQARSRYLGERANDYAFIHLDCASLAHNDEAEILSEIAAQLHHEGISARRSSLFQGPGSPRRALREQVLDLDPDLNLVWVLDYFDEVAAKLDKSFFNYLFHLRNIRPRGNLVYVFATRRPLGHLHELHELLDDPCFIRPLSYKDALASIQRDEMRLGCTFDAAQRDKLIACTGGHPGFLKNAAELLASGKIDARLPDTETARQLLQSDKIENLCTELWNDLTAVEQGILGKRANGIPLTQTANNADSAYLEKSGVLVKKETGRGKLDLGIFSPLFETFVRNATPAGAVRVTAVFPNQARVKTWTREERITLSPKLFALLLALTEARGRVLPTDEVINRVYGDEAAGVTNAALSQLVKRLRGMLDPHAQRMTDDPAYTCVETIRDVGYRLNG